MRALSMQPSAVTPLVRRPRHEAGARRRQRGAGFGGIMIVIVLVVFFANLAIVMAPSYATFWQVRSMMDGLVERDDILAKGARGISNSLSSQLNVNSIRDLRVGDFKLERIQGGHNLILDYEVRKHLFFNVDVVMDFAHQVELKTP
jgi:hypothetical protein